MTRKCLKDCMKEVNGVLAVKVKESLVSHPKSVEVRLIGWFRSVDIADKLYYSLPVGIETRGSHSYKHPNTRLYRFTRIHLFNFWKWFTR